MDLVIIEWLDAHTLGQDEIPSDKAVEAAHHGYKTRSTGFLVKSDSDGVTLTTDVQIGAEATTYRHLHFVPRGMIVSEVVVPEAPKRKGRK